MLFEQCPGTAMNNLISPTTTRNTARGQTPNAHAAPLPIAGAAQHLARELTAHGSNDLFWSAIELITLNYLPHPAFLTLLHDQLPIQSNPLAQLTSARTIDELLACRDDLEQFLGRNQSGKTSLLRVDQSLHISVPSILIKHFLGAINRNQQPLHMLPYEQQEQVMEFSIFLAEFTQSHPAPKQHIKELTPLDTHFFLQCLSWRVDARPMSTAISDIRHELAIHLLDDHVQHIAQLPFDLSDNTRFIEQAIILHSRTAFNFASNRLQNTPHIQKLLGYRTGHISLARPSAPEDVDCPMMAMAAAFENEAELHHISDRLRNDRNFVMATASEEPFVLAVCADEFTNDYEFMLEAVSQHGWALEYASDALLDDPDIVLAAVRKNGEALQFASDRLRAHPQITWAAVTQNRNAIHYVIPAHQNAQS